MNLAKKNKKNKTVTKKLNSRFKKHGEETASLVHNDTERIRDLINKKIVSMFYKNTDKKVNKTMSETKNKEALMENILDDFKSPVDPLTLLKEITKNSLREDLEENFRMKMQKKSEDLVDIGSAKRLFNNLDKDEFGVSRLAADQTNHIIKLIDNFKAPKRVNSGSKKGLYKMCSETTNSLEDTIRLEYEFTAKNQEEANEHAQDYIKRLRGRQHKILLACWCMGDLKRKRRSIICKLSELMKLSYPDREAASFTATEKEDYFRDLLDLSYTQITVTKNKPSRSKIKQFIIPLLTVFGTSGHNLESDEELQKYPNIVEFSLLYNPAYEKEVLYRVGAPIKKKTLSSHENDILLSKWIQTRKSQLMKSKYIEFVDREELLLLAGINIQHTGMQNVRLLKKLKRLKEEGAIIDHPPKITFPLLIKIR